MKEINKLLVTSSAFKEGELIPRRYTCDGANINPPLEINNMPEGTQSVAIIMDDPDAPSGTYTHWIVWNLPPDISLPEGKEHTTSGINSSGKAGYFGPCPPGGTHRYYFRVYALKTSLSLNNTIDRKEFENQIQKNILASGCLMGLYERKK